MAGLQDILGRVLGVRTKQQAQAMSAEEQKAAMMQARSDAINDMPAQGNFGQNFAAYLRGNASDPALSGASSFALRQGANREAEAMNAANMWKLENEQAIAEKERQLKVILARIAADPRHALAYKNDGTGSAQGELIANNLATQGYRAQNLETISKATEAGNRAGLNTKDYVPIVEQAGSIVEGVPTNPIGADPSGLGGPDRRALKTNELDNATDLNIARINADASIASARARGSGGGEGSIGWTVEIDPVTGHQKRTFRGKGAMPDHLLNAGGSSGGKRQLTPQELTRIARLNIGKNANGASVVAWEPSDNPRNFNARYSDGSVYTLPIPQGR